MGEAENGITYHDCVQSLSDDVRINLADNDKYQCSLDNESLRRAERDWEENPQNRTASVAAIRQWISREHSWLSTPTNSVFLLGFLRMRKFSQYMTRMTLDSYWTARTENPIWFKDVDTTANNMHNIIRAGSLVLLPGRDKNGSKVILLRPGLLDGAAGYTNDDVYRTAFAVGDYLLLDEDIQVNGFTVITDFSYMSMRNKNIQMGVASIKKNFAIWGKTYPVRVKKLHHYNMGTLGEFIMKIAQPFLPTKLIQRIVNHSSMVSVYEHIDQSMLPDEYLPDDHEGPSAGTIAQLAESLIDELTKPEIKNYIWALSSGEYYVRKDRPTSTETVLYESYRKLDV